MKNSNKLVLLFCLIFVTLLGCSTQLTVASNNMDEQFSKLVSVTDMNKSLHLVVDGDKKAFRLGDTIPLLVYNKSSSFVAIEANSSIKLFTISDGEWKKVKNKLSYSGSMVMSPQGTVLLDFTNTWAKPAFDIKPTDKEISLRILATGEITKNDLKTGDFVGAYVDVYITS